MSHSATPLLSVGSTAPEALPLLHQRLLVAEEQAEALIRDMGSLGVSRDQLFVPVHNRDPIQWHVSPLNMHRVLVGENGSEGMLGRQCDSLVSRVYHMESLLQTLKLTTFRLETERELDPSHTARLKEKLAALQQESEEEQRASTREVMKLRDELRQACEEREEARRAVQKLGEALEMATAAKVNVSLAAEEFKIVNVQMSNKLMEMKEQMSQESALTFEAMKSQSQLLQRVEELERAVTMERRQAQLVQADCQALRSEGQTSRQKLQQEQDKAGRLQEHCQQLSQQTEAKNSLVSELKTELKSVRLVLQKQQKENSKLLKENSELRATPDRLQALNSELEGQCAQLNSALRSLSMQNAKQQSEHQASLKAEKSRVLKQLHEQDLLLEAARCNVQAELQGALSDKVRLQMELEKLKADHTQLLQSSMIAQETAMTQKEMLERTIQRLRGELNTVKSEKEAGKKDWDISKNMLCDLEAGSDGPSSAVKLHFNSQTLQPEPGSLELETLRKDRLRAQREIERHQAEVEKLQDLLTSTHSKNHKALASLRKSLDTARTDNKRLAQSLEHALVIQSNLQTRLEQAREQHQATITQREEKLGEARTAIAHLSEELESIKHRTSNNSSRRVMRHENLSLRKSLEESSVRSGDLSRANRKLQQQVLELEKRVSKYVRGQKSEQRHHLESHASLRNSQEVKTLSSEWSDWERWASTIQRWESKKELSRITRGYRPGRTELTTT